MLNSVSRGFGATSENLQQQDTVYVELMKINFNTQNLHYNQGVHHFNSCSLDLGYRGISFIRLCQHLFNSLFLLSYTKLHTNNVIIFIGCNIPLSYECLP